VRMRERQSAPCERIKERKDVSNDLSGERDISLT
jgi:hypothetical protein